MNKMSDSNEMKNLMQGLGKMMSADTPEEAESIFGKVFENEIAASENAPQLPDTIVIEYADGTKETLDTRSK